MATRKFLLSAVVTGLVLAACSTTTSGNGGTGGSGSSGSSSAGIGDRVRDGSFEFVVKSNHCGKSKIGSGITATKAQGQFCVVSLTVKNIKNEAQLFDATDQYMFDAKGRKFSASTDALISLPNSNAFLNNINPGNSVEGEVAFDIPKDDQPIKLVLHDSPFSNGVTVDL